MRITIAALGTRGDVQPMIALGIGLKSAGHEVRLIAGSNFGAWVAGHGLAFVPSVDMDALMGSEQGVAWSQGSDNPMRQLRLMRDLMATHDREMFEPIQASAASSDLLISSFSVLPLVQTVSEKSGVPYLNALLQPQLPTRSGAASLITPFPGLDTPVNRWLGMLAGRLIWWVGEDTTNRFRAQIGLKAHSPASYLRAIHTAPAVLGCSPHVVPPPSDWPELAVTGYWFLDEAWSPPSELVAFLEGGEPPVYIGFGSMTGHEPEATLAMILGALRQAGGRALIAGGWGGMPNGELPPEVFALGGAPHHWLFPRVAAVVHHGGAGTTAAGLRAGRPTMIVPHMADQPYWGRRVGELGAGVPAVPRHKLTAEALAAGLIRLRQDGRIRETAAALGAKIRAERGVEAAVAAIEALGIGMKYGSQGGPPLHSA